MSEKEDQSKSKGKISHKSRDQSHTFPSDLTDFEQQIARDMKRFAQKQAEEGKIESSMLESTLPDIKFSYQKEQLSNFSGERSEIKMKSISMDKASEKKSTSESAFGSIKQSVELELESKTSKQKSGKSGRKSSKRSPRSLKKNDNSR